MISETKGALLDGVSILITGNLLKNALNLDLPYLFSEYQSMIVMFPHISIQSSRRTGFHCATNTE